MVPRNLFIAVICAGVMAWSGLARAEQYRPGEFLTLDLSKAVLSPKALGPASGFTPGPLDVKTDNGSAGFHANTATANTETANAQPAGTEPKAAPTITVHKARMVQAEKPRGSARTKLAKRHGSPLDAQAFDARVQVWPCRSGGICNWKK
ncbi:hypothetical protein [Bradyrhizobium sp. dw_411]|uniref:hypothetical protein n=1 Tax=Bradyrhizobium sp. dw_411 TaxID=2720082 RepID=UPI001BCC8D75|nr:hypothetical protein [Bradyrhizobium sp. dw_411]